MGVIVYRLVIRQILGAPMLIQIFATFGLMILMRYVAFYFFKPNYRSIQQTLLSGNIDLGGVYLAVPPLAAAVGAFLTTGAVYVLIHKTRMGGALQATAEDREAAALMGIDTDRMFMLAWGIGAATAGIAGSLLSTFFYIFPEVGGIFGLIAFVPVTLGGFGNVAGAFVAGILIGVIEALAGHFYDPALKTVSFTPCSSECLFPPPGTPPSEVGEGIRVWKTGTVCPARSDACGRCRLPVHFPQAVPAGPGDQGLSLRGAGVGLERARGIHGAGIAWKRDLLRRGGLCDRGGPDPLGMDTVDRHGPRHGSAAVSLSYSGTPASA